MDTKDLKMFAAYYTVEHDNLTKKDKIKVLEFIKDAPIHQVEHLLSTGIVDPNITREKVPALEINFSEQSWGDIGKAMTGKTYDVGVAQGVQGAVAVAAAALLARKVFRRFLSKAARACKDKAGAAKTLCMNEFKKKAMQAQASSLQQSKSKCAKSKQPDKCNAAIDKKIAMIKSKIV